MTLKVVEPINITEAVLTASDIPEPDASVGEVEWEDRQVPTYISGDKDRYTSVTANDGNVYSFGYGTGDILKIDINNQSSSLMPGISGNFSASTLADDGYIYAINGSNGDVIKFDTNTEVSSVVISGLPTGSYHCDLGGDGNIYAVRAASTSEVVKIDVVGLSWSSLGLFSGDYGCSVTGADGNFYAISSNDFLYLNTKTGSISEIDGYSELPFFSATVGVDNKIYAVGYNQVMEIDTSDLSFSFFGSYSSIFRSSNLGSDGSIYCFSSNSSGLDNEIMILDTSSKSVTIIGYSPNNHHTSSVGGDGSIYCPSSDSNDILKITPRYKVGDRVVLTSEHKQYQCLVDTYENPKIGATEDATATWIEVGPTNKWAMFDDQNSTTTKSSGSFSLDLESNNYIMAYGVTGSSGLTSVRCQVYDSGSSLIYDDTQSAFDNVGAPGDFIYASEDVFYKKKLYQTDIPPTENFKAVFTFNGSDIEIGNLTVGPAIELGPCLSDSKNESLDLSEQVFDDFGNETYTERPIITFATYETISSIESSNIINRFLNVIRRKGCLWIGEVGYNQSIVTFGRIERDPIPYTMPTEIRYTIRVRGFA